MTDIKALFSEKSKKAITEISKACAVSIASQVRKAFELGYNQAVQEFRDRTFTPKQYKITFEDFGENMSPVFNEDFDEAMAIYDDFNKRGFKNVKMQLVDIRGEN